MSIINFNSELIQVEKDGGEFTFSIYVDDRASFEALARLLRGRPQTAIFPKYKEYYFEVIDNVYIVYKETSEKKRLLNEIRAGEELYSGF